MIVLPHTGLEGACRIAETLRKALEQACWPERPITASFGVATWTSKMTNTALVAQADTALYHSKHRGRNRVSHLQDCEAVLVIEDSIWEATSDFASRYPTAAATRDHSAIDVIHTYDRTIECWSRMLNLRDRETEGHAVRVTQMALRLAQKMGLRAEEQGYLRWGSLLHDLGKIAIPDSILLKPGPLTAEEQEIMSHHPTYAHEMLSPVPFLRPALDVPLYHHEKWDGSGYPYGLKGKEIPLAARLFAVVDVWDALRSDRPYRKGWPEEEVRAYIRAEAGQHFDPEITAIFLALLAETAGEALS